MSPRNHSVAVLQSQYHIIDSTNPRGALDDRIEHWLHIGRRATDDIEHLGCCRLMLQRFAQFCVPLLEFFEQTDILDGDHSLIRERFQERDFLFGERPNLDSTDGNRADHSAFTDHWHADSTPKVENLAERLAIFRIHLRVRDMHNTSLLNDAPVYAGSRRAHRKDVLHNLGALSGNM